MKSLGFIGLGVMGTPMAHNLVREILSQGLPPGDASSVRVWNRTSQRTEQFCAQTGATAAASARDVLRHSTLTFMMLVNEQAIDAVLERGSDAFADNVAQTTVVSMSSVAPAFSEALAADIRAAGGRYLEAPVSGSRKPAEMATLVGLLGGTEDDRTLAAPYLRTMCGALVPCGDVGMALRMKLAVNLYLTAMVAALMEADHFAQNLGLPLDRFAEAISAGPMASDITAVKLPKVLAGDFSIQAALSDAHTITCLIAEEARQANIATPLLDVSRQLYQRATELTDPRSDMISVLKAIEEQTDHLRAPTKTPTPLQATPAL